MKAIEMHGYGDVDQLHYDDVPMPKPGPNEVLVKVGAASVNPIDWKIRRGDLKAMMPVQFPAIPGRDFAGEVVEVGSAVSSFKPGQKVMGVGNQTYAEYVSVPSANVTPIPDGLALEEAGALPLVATTGAELIDRIAPKRAATVLVTGALGSVGRAAVYASKQRGARVIAGVRESQKQPNAQNLGKFAEAARKHEFNIPIAKRFKLSQAADAQKLAEQGKADGKIVLIP
jgi:NADPH:quinone reductase-like Zn-dependent oxidoreductase